jgi:hypothetical protein
MAKQKNAISIQISVTPSAKAAVDRIAGHTEIPQKRVLSKIYEWFARLPAPAQKSILWPEENATELEAMMVALDYLELRRQEMASSGRESGPPAPKPSRDDLRSRAAIKLRDIRERTPTSTPTTPSLPHPPHETP